MKLDRNFSFLVYWLLMFGVQ